MSSTTRALIADLPAEFTWPEFDETTACGLCYTSGTTGNPKGALYHHRSTVLHALTLIMPEVMGLSARDTVLPVVPMFHVNAWGLPYACPLVGARMVMPGPRLDGASLYQQFEREGVTFAAGVPTIWFGLLNHLRETGQRLTSLRRAVIGGAAPPPSMIEAFEEEYGVEVLHGWGMTEMRPGRRGVRHGPGYGGVARAGAAPDQAEAGPGALERRTQDRGRSGQAAAARR